MAKPTFPHPHRLAREPVLDIGILDLSFDLAQDGELVEPFVIWSLGFGIRDLSMGSSWQVF